MFKISYDKKITMVQGDTGVIRMKIHNYELSKGDEVRFAIVNKANPSILLCQHSDKKIVLEKQVTVFEKDGSARIVIYPDNTEYLQPGKYLYEIQVKTKDGRVDTVVPLVSFTLMAGSIQGEYGQPTPSKPEPTPSEIELRFKRLENEIIPELGNRITNVENEIDGVSSSLDTKETKTTLEILSANMSATGDCMILKTKNGTNILCDTGSLSKWSEVDTFLSKNIDKLDYVIITHYHGDHVGNLENILKKYKSDNCIAILPCEPDFLKMNINGTEFEAATQSAYNICDTYGVIKKIPYEGEILEIDDIKIKFLNCSLDLFENYYNTQSEFYSDGSTDYNNFSLVFELIHNNNKMLFTGDINVTAQETLLPYLQKYDLLKCPHHSVDTKVHLPFMQKTSPTLAFSNNNGQNSLPKSEITRWLLTRGIPYYVTCQSGDLKLISDGFKITSINKTYTTDLNMKGFLSSFGVSNYMYFGFEDISKKYKNTSTLEDMIKEMEEGSTATVNFISGENITPSFISSYNGSGFIQKATTNKATIILFDNRPDTFNCYIGLWHSSEESVVWHKLGSDEKIENLNKKVKLTLYNTYGSMSGLGISSSSTALEMVKAMPASSLYSGYVTQSFDNKLDTYGAMVDIKKSSNNLIAKITMTTANPNNIVMYEGIYHQNVGNYIKWKKITLTDV